jgi:hypothetical protein
LWIPVTDPDDDAASGTYWYAIWDKIAEGIGNFQALREITITETISLYDEDDPIAPDWEILACTLRRLWRGVQLRMWNDDALLWIQKLCQVLLE